MKLIWKLLRHHISIAQLAGFFFANLIGMCILLTALQFYTDVRPLFSEKEGALSGEDYFIVSKPVSTLGSLVGRKSGFSESELNQLQEQPWVKSAAPLTPAAFSVRGGIEMSGTELQVSTELFFESVPNDFVDVDAEKWVFHSGDQEIPIILPRNYLNLYNFGFAPSKGLPKLSESMLGMIRMNLQLRGKLSTETYTGRIVGFSNRINTILVPDNFIRQANERLAPQASNQASRIILKVQNPTDQRIPQYLEAHNLEVEGGKGEAGKASYFLSLLVSIVGGVGGIICLLSFYLLVLSIFLLLQKNEEKLRNLQLIGYSVRQISLPYNLLTAGIHLLILFSSLTLVGALREIYLSNLSVMFPDLGNARMDSAVLMGCTLFLIITIGNILIIQLKVKGSIKQNH